MGSRTLRQIEPAEEALIGTASSAREPRPNQTRA
jgi:hypothetical protein